MSITLRYGDGTGIDYGNDQGSAQADAILARKAAEAPAALADPAIARNAPAKVEGAPSGLTLGQKAGVASDLAVQGMAGQAAIYSKLARELSEGEDRTVFTSSKKAKTPAAGHQPNLADQVDRTGAILTAIQQLADMADTLARRVQALETRKKGQRRGPQSS